MNAAVRLLLLALTFTGLRAETLWIEGERLVPADRPLGVEGAPPGWYKVPLFTAEDSGAASLVSAPRLAPGEVSAQEARIQAPARAWYIWVRTAGGDAGGFRLLLDDQPLDLTPSAGTAPAWLRAAQSPLTLGSPIRVRLEDDEPTAAAALDVLVLTDDPTLDPATMPLPRWPGAAQARDLSARLWVPAMFDRPLHLVRGLAWPVLLAVTNRRATPVAGGRIELTLPPGIELLNPTERGFPDAEQEPFSLTAVTPTAVERRGATVLLTLPEVPAELDGMTARDGAVALFLRTDETADGGVIELVTSAPGQEPQGWRGEVELLDLPPGAGPKRAYWLLDAPGLAAFGEPERAAFLAGAARVGYNRINLPDQLTGDDSRYDRSFGQRCSDLAIEVRQAGLTPVLGMAPWIPWTPERSYSDRYLAEHPAARAVQAAGSRALAQGREVVSPTHLLDEDSTYLDSRLTALADLAHRAGIHEIRWDYLENRPLEVSFDGATLDRFERSRGGGDPGGALGPAPRRDPLTILSDPTLREAWISFRCEQNTAIAGMLRRQFAARVRDLRLHVRSGSQSAATKATYGVDWRLLAPFADGIIADRGDGADPLAELHATWQAAALASPRALPMSVARAIGDGPGGARWTDPSTNAARAILAAAAGAPGLDDLGLWFAAEGEHLTGLAAAARFVAAHEAPLLVGDRTTHDTNDDGLIDTVVVRDGKTVLTVVANRTPHPQVARPGVGQAGELPATLPLLAGEWRAFESAVDG